MTKSHACALGRSRHRPKPRAIDERHIRKVQNRRPAGVSQTVEHRAQPWRSHKINIPADSDGDAFAYRQPVEKTDADRGDPITNFKRRRHSQLSVIERVFRKSGGDTVNDRPTDALHRPL
jgi:hypothetical protein